MIASFSDEFQTLKSGEDAKKLGKVQKKLQRKADFSAVQSLHYPYREIVQRKT